MKKPIIIIYAVTLVSFVLTAQKVKSPSPPKVRMVTITLTENTWRVAFAAIDKSDFPHLTIKALQDSLYPQFNDTIKNPLPK